jgi:hypothetical protein
MGNIEVRERACMKTAGSKMHFVPLGDINETPHINDTGSIPSGQILHLSTGPKQADPAPNQARDLFVLENRMAISKDLRAKTLQRKGFDNAATNFRRPCLPAGSAACRVNEVPSPLEGEGGR